MTSTATSQGPITQRHPACEDAAEKRRLAQRHGVSLATIDDLCRRVGSGRAALEAALTLLLLSDTAETARA